MPRVTYASISKPQPDRLEDAVELARQAAKLTGRHGAEARLLAADTAGEQSGTMVFAVEFESVERYAALIQEITDDPEVRALRISLTRSIAPIVGLSTSLSLEIPLPGTHKTGRGNVVEVHIVKPLPGRLEDTIKETESAATLLEKAGAVNVQLFQMMYAGTQSGSLGIAIEWPSIGAQAKSGLVWANEPAGVALMTAVLNGTMASTLLSSALFVDIPL